MRQLAALALVMLVGSCDNTWDSPNSYPVSEGYGSPALAYGSSSGSSQYILVDTAGEDTAEKEDVPEKETKPGEDAANPTDTQQTCEEQYGKPYCECEKTEAEKHPSPRGYYCECYHVVCTNDPDKGKKFPNIKVIEDCYQDATDIIDVALQNQCANTQ
jgi:hypothetical protein